MKIYVLIAHRERRRRGGGGQGGAKNSHIKCELLLHQQLYYDQKIFADYLVHNE
jgi:hypothetical protein